MNRHTLTLLALTASLGVAEPPVYPRRRIPDYGPPPKPREPDAAELAAEEKRARKAAKAARDAERAARGAS